MRACVICAALLSACAGSQAVSPDWEAQLRTLQAQVARQSELLERLQADVLVLKDHRAPEKATAPRAANPDVLFAEALGAYQHGDSRAAELLFVRFVESFDGHARFADALYWLGECRFEQEQFGAAGTAFEQVVRRFPKSDRAPEALLKLGLSYEGAQDHARARTAFAELIKTYPSSAVADVARVRVAAVRP